MFALSIRRDRTPRVLRKLARAEGDAPSHGASRQLPTRSMA